MSGNMYKDYFVEMGDRERAWHKIASRVYAAGENPTLQEALGDAHCDYEITTVPHVVKFDGVEIQTDKFDIVRKPTATDPAFYFGTVSKRWEPVQNAALVEMFAPLTKYYPLETMGALDNGKVFFFTFRGASFEVTSNGKADPAELFTYMVDYKGAGRSLWVGSGAERIVCENTLMSASAAAVWSVDVAHKTGAGELVDLMAKSLVKIASTQAAVREAYQNMANTRLSLEQARRAFEIAFPTPVQSRTVRGLTTAYAGKDGGSAKIERLTDVIRETATMSDSLAERITTAEESHETAIDKAAYLREVANASLGNMADGQGLGLTAWTVFNAVSETLEHRAERTRGDVARDLLFDKRRAVLDRTANWLTAVVKENAV